MEINNFLTEAIGVDKYGRTNVNIVANVSMFDKNSDNEKVLLTRTMENPIFNIVHKGDFIEICLEFKTDIDVDFKMLKRTLIEFDNRVYSYHENDSEYPFHEIAISPKKYEGKIYLSCKNPIIWALQPKTDDGKLVLLKVLYDLDQIHLVEIPDEEYEKITKEIDLEIEREEQLYDAKQNEELETFDYEEKMLNY